MRPCLFKIALIFLFASCGTGTLINSTDDTASALIADSLGIKPADTTIKTYDTTLLLFSDSSYKLDFHFLDTKSTREEKTNSIVTFNFTRNDTTVRLFQDSFYCMNTMIKRKDFNNDNIKDILFFYYTGGRANPTYHLYVIDTVKYSLTYIKGFENLPNPDLDSSNNIITSAALAGTDIIWSFYRINSQNKLVDLKHGFTADLDDSIKYDKAIKEILKK